MERDRGDRKPQGAARKSRWGAVLFTALLMVGASSLMSSSLLNRAESSAAGLSQSNDVLASSAGETAWDSRTDGSWLEEGDLGMPGDYPALVDHSLGKKLQDPQDAGEAEPAEGERGREGRGRRGRDGEDVCLVIGCGPVGLAVIAALKQKGLGPVIAADFSPRRRDLAEQVGADDVIDPAQTSPYESWQQTAWPKNVDRNDPMLRFSGVNPKPGLIFECVGVPGVIDQVIHGAMKNTRIVVVGVCMEQDSFRPLTGIGKELNIQFVLGYTAEEFANTLTLISEGELVVDQLITGRVGLSEVGQAFDDLGDPEAHAKIIVEPWR